MTSESDTDARAVTSVWRGERMCLRAMEPEDWAAFFANNEDSEGARRSWFIPFPRSAAGQRRWAEEIALKTAENDAFRWVITDHENTVVGTINTHSCDRRVGSFSYGIGVFRQFGRRGYASEAITLVLRYFFAELRYQKCTVEAYDYNEPSIRLHERLGFQHEGRIRRVVFTHGRHCDAIMLGITAEEFAARHGAV